MSKIYPNKPFLLLFYGYPGAGKTYFARQFCENVQAAHLQSDRVRGELFEEPRYDKQENEVVNQLMDYMTEEFLIAGLSVAYDVNAMRTKQRRQLYDLAYRTHAQPLLVWFQMDPETAYFRNNNHMQNPTAGEDYIVISGKHLFNMQQSAVLSKLRATGVLDHEGSSSRIIKPGLVNLVPKGPGRIDNTRRNISIR
jgi:predicted kinase